MPGWRGTSNDCFLGPQSSRVRAPIIVAEKIVAELRSVNYGNLKSTVKDRRRFLVLGSKLQRQLQHGLFCMGDLAKGEAVCIAGLSAAEPVDRVAGDGGLTRGAHV